MVLCDYRRIVTELQARENDVFSAYDQFALSPDRVRRRYLANAALSVARDFAQAEPAAWGWIKPAGGRPARRLPGFESAPYTQPEAELLREERDLVQHRTAVEQWGSSKYAWMRQPAYREMCYDALRSPEDGKATVLAEGALLDRATESTAGRTFLTEYAVGNGSWYTRYVLHPLPYETEQVRTTAVVADAYWTILGALAAARLGAAEAATPRGPDAAALGQPRDVVKNTLGVVDDRLKQPVEPAAAARRAAAEAVPAGEQDARAAHDLRRRVDGRVASYEAVLAEESRLHAVIIEDLVVVSVARYTNVRLGVAGVDAMTGKLAVVRATVDAPASQHPDLGAWLAESRQEAGAAFGAEQGASQRLETLRLRLLNTEQLEERYAGRAWLTTRGLMVLSAVNIALAIQAAHDEPGWT